MPDICPQTGELVEGAIHKVLDQYRESPNLLGVIRAALAQVEEVAQVICAIPPYFNLNTAVGEQLTIAGRVLGVPRCHCVCLLPPVVGYDCGGYVGPYALAGYCEPGSTFLACMVPGTTDVCVDDDEIYRSILKARRYQLLGLFDIESLEDAIRLVWGEDADVVTDTVGTVLLSPGRALSVYEQSLVPIVFRALPIAPGIKGMIHYGLGPIAGYGAGWAGYCGGEIPCPEDPHPYTC